mgnify:CR=1 FL=1
MERNTPLDQVRHAHKYPRFSLNILSDKRIIYFNFLRISGFNTLQIIDDYIDTYMNCRIWTVGCQRDICKMSDLQSIATASCNISLVIAKSHSDVSSRLITKYKYKDFKKLQRIFEVKTVVLNFAEEFIIHQMEEFHSLIVLGQKLNLQVSHEPWNKIKGLQAAQNTPFTASNLRTQ